MEESKSKSEWASERSTETAEILRDLRLQADESLLARKRHLSDIETGINFHIQHVASELAHELTEANATEANDSYDVLLGQVDQLTVQIEQEIQQQVQLQENQTCLEEEKSQLQEQLQSQTEQIQQQQQLLSEQESELARSQEGLQQAVATRDQQEQQVREREEVLQVAQQQAQAAQQEQQQLNEQLEQSQRKVELVLDDIQRLQVENTDLQESLLQSSKESIDSAEMESLLAERDALAARIGELEEAPTQALDAEQAEQFADLQQRYEMAATDLRQLKQDKTELAAKLENLQGNSSVVVNDGPLDWQAQKALMLASLEDEECGHDDAPRQQERTTIEGTLAITDQVVAEKDQVIHSLREQLDVSQASDAPEVASRDQHVEQSQENHANELFADDELIQHERERLEQLQQEWEEKLRNAELEISVERATLAREKVALDEKLSVLKELPAAGSQESDQRPRRRWLAALGIKSDDED